MGELDGVNLFAAVDAAAIRVIHIPVQPGLFQTYRAQVDPGPG